MSNSPYCRDESSSSALNVKSELSSDEHIGRDSERDSELTVVGLLQNYERYYQMAWNVAYLILGHSFDADADIVADKVMDEIIKREHLPLKSEIEKHVRILARSRALDHRLSPKYRFRKTIQSIIQRNGDDEEYEVVPESGCSLGAEEEYFYLEEREQFARRFAEAVSRLNDRQRICFVLRFVEGLTPKEITEELRIPVDIVSTEIYRARVKVRQMLVT